MLSMYCKRLPLLFMQQCYVSPRLTVIAGKKTQAEQLTVKPPKRVGNAFAIYIRQEIEKHRKNNISNKEAFKLIGESWNRLTESEKGIYKRQVKEEMAKYNEELKIFNKTVTPEQLEILNHLKSKKKLDKAKRKQMTEKKEKELLYGKPKAPGGLFVYYMQTLNQGDLSYKDFIIEASKKWRSLPSYDKENYIKTYQINLNNYKTELEKWERKMIQNGEKDLVRKSTLEKSS